MDVAMKAKSTQTEVTTPAATGPKPRLPRYEHRSRNWAESLSYCPKCGFEGYMEMGLMRWWKPVYIAEHLAPGMVGRGSECLLVKCKVCSYSWTEDVLEPEIAPN